MLRGLGGLLAAPAAVLQGAEDTAPLDEAMQNLMRRHGIPGGALAIARAGQLVYAQGFGFSSRERGEAATAESKFRLASLSKPITAMAILRLMEQGRLGLDEAILPRLNLEPLHGTFADGRWENKSSDGTTWKNFEVEKVYESKDGKWKTTNQFDETELLELKNAIDKAIYGETITEK
jgi:hypothetical protein